MDNAYPIYDALTNQEEVLLHARAICGIVLTNPNAQALIVMCHMATISSIFFTDKSYQAENSESALDGARCDGSPVSRYQKEVATLLGTVNR